MMAKSGIEPVNDPDALPGRDPRRGRHAGQREAAGGHARLSRLRTSKRPPAARRRSSWCATWSPDLILLDIMMPGLDGYDVCRTVRADPAHAMLPIVMVTALDGREERVKGLEAGADDFLSKPVNPPELLARVRSLLRIRRLYETVQRQADQLAAWNRTLEARVTEQVAHVEKLSRLKRFFSPQLAELILAGGADDPLESHRREITVVFLDLRGFTAFAEAAEPEEVMRALRRVPPRDGRAHPRVPGHARALHRRRHDGVLQRSAADPGAGAPRGARWPSRCRRTRSSSPRSGRSAATTLGLGHRHRPGLRDGGRHRLRGAHRLRRHRQRDQPRQPAVRPRRRRRHPRRRSACTRRSASACTPRTSAR